MIVNPPGQITPVTALLEMVSKPWNDNRSPCPHAPILITTIPDMVAVIGIVARTVQFVRIAKSIQLGAAKARPHRHPPERVLQWFEQLLAKLLSRGNRQVRVVRNVGNAMNRADFGIEKIAHVKAFRQADPAQCLKAPHAGRFAHQYPFQRKAPSSRNGENGLCATSQTCPSGSQK